MQAFSLLRERILNNCTIKRYNWTWVDWFNNRCLLEPIGHVPPAQKELEYYQQLASQAEAA